MSTGEMYKIIASEIAKERESELSPPAGLVRSNLQLYEVD